MHIPTATGSPPAAPLSAQSVSAAMLKRANSDGDGRTGTAALNDGDAVAQAAAQQAKAGKVDLKA